MLNTLSLDYFSYLTVQREDLLRFFLLISKSLTNYYVSRKPPFKLYTS